jgi:hypothetical protein
VNIISGGILALRLAAGPWPECGKLHEPTDTATLHLGDSLARRFAPPLSFAPGERFFPTIPFFTALDGDGTMGDPARKDFEDPREVAPYLLGSSGETVDTDHISWKALLDAYHPDHPADSLQDQQLNEYALRRVVVLYRVCSLTTNQNRNVERFLKSDEQAFDRYEDTQRLAAIFGAKPQFNVIQYFLYYLADKGLQGHPNDIELVSVFFPNDLGKLQQFRIMVGSGHSPRTPNNVLVLSAYHRGETKLPDSTFVMVELGGHSSAPDLPPIGRFTPGLDANWHAYNVWGTRDAQAAGGVGYLGQYAQAMTFDRGYGSDGILVFPPRYDSTHMAATQQQVQGDTSKPVRGPAQHQYRLLPIRLLTDLDTLLAPDRALPDSARLDGISEAVSAIQQSLCPSRRDGRSGCEGLDAATWNSTPFPALPDSTRLIAIRAMRRWREGMIIDETFRRFEPLRQAFPGLPRLVQPLSSTPRDLRAATTQRPWEHESFRGKCKQGEDCEGKADPTEVFKSHLFRPNTYTVQMDGGLRNLLLLGMTAAPTDGYELYTGVVVPAFRSHGLPIRLGGFLELHVGVNCGWRCRAVSPTFGILQEGHRNSIISWYVAANWVPRRPEVTARPDAGEFNLGGGVSLLPHIDEHMFRLVNVIRVRAGVRFDPFEGKDLLNRVRWELQLAVRQ